MKNKAGRHGGEEFREFKSTIFLRTIILMTVSFLGIMFLYRFVAYKRFADWMVDGFQNMFGMTFDDAMNLYNRTFRRYEDLIFLLAMGIVFFIVFRLYLNWFVEYFRQINRGIDTLITEDAEDVLLPPELAATEKKINTIRHTLKTRKLDAQLAEQRRNDLIVYLAHDLKTPLASVIGYLNLLRDEGQISEELREKYLSISLEKAERLEDLINEFFEIARYNLSEMTLQKSRINLTRLLEMLVYEFQPMLAEHDLTCLLDAGQDVMLICDGDKLQRVFDNLLRNAVLYSYPGTEISVALWAETDVLLIRVENRGATIPAHQLERIFEQFYRLDSARSTKSGGAGLGLAIAKRIVELHGGTITAVSEAEVTSFLVSLPLARNRKEIVRKSVEETRKEDRWFWYNPDKERQRPSVFLWRIFGFRLPGCDKGGKMMLILRDMFEYFLIGAVGILMLGILYLPFFLVLRGKVPIGRQIVCFLFAACVLVILTVTVLGWAVMRVWCGEGLFAEEHFYNFIPFHSLLEEWDMGARKKVTQIIANILMFVPPGCLLPAVSVRQRSLRKALLFSFLFSTAIEFLQFFIGRSTDVDDILLNVCGGAAGYGIYKILTMKWKKKRVDMAGAATKEKAKATGGK